MGRDVLQSGTIIDGFLVGEKLHVGGMASLVPETGTLYQVWLKHDIDPGFREELMLAVSKLNDCRYCTWGHHEWAHMLGVPDEEIGRSHV